MSDNTTEEDKGCDCPTCGENFDSTRGMKIHHKRIHGESVAGVESTCEYCGDTYSTQKSTAESSRFCTRECQIKQYTEEYSGSDSPHWKGGKVEKECVICGDSYEAFPVNADSRVICSREGECAQKYKQLTAPTGEDHWNWKGGYENYYGPNWSKQRDRVRERDGYECRRCGIPESEHRRELDVHHIRRIEWYKENYEEPDWYKLGNALDNLITMCMECHKRWEGIPLKPQKHE